MKLLRLLLLALAGLPLAVLAQEAATDEPSLIPELPAPGPRPNSPAAPGTGAAPKSSTEKASDDLLARIRYRNVKTRALQDPGIQEEWARAHRMKTDPELRAGLKNYYRLLYGRMIRLDSSVKKRANLALRAATSRIEGHIGVPKGSRRRGASSTTEIDPDHDIDPENY